MATAYAQQGAKRPKIRESSRVTDSSDYFQAMAKVEYNSEALPTDSTAYRYYNAAERVQGRSMEEWLRFSVSFTAFRSDGSDWTGRPTFNRTWDDHSNSIDNYKRCIKACFDFCTKLGVKYWTAFDSDLVPYSDTWEEYRTNCDEIAEYVLENVQRTHVKLLWIAPDLHSHPRYASGASTSCDANIFISAATQVKKSLELAQRLNAECFLLWPHREGYDTLFKSDVPKEMKLFANLLKMTAEFKERIPYRGQLLILPYCENNFTSIKRNYICDGNKVLFKERDVSRYMWDTTSCLYFLKHFNLDRHYKVCAPPGHQMYLANIFNTLGGVEINNDVNQFDFLTLTEMMKSIIDQGAVLPGGVNISVKPRRDSVDLRDLMSTYINRIDGVARGLRSASHIITDQVFSKHMQQRYVTYSSGYGPRLLSGDSSLEDCEEHAKKSQHHNSDNVMSARAEHWENVFQRYLDIGDRM